MPIKKTFQSLNASSPPTDVDSELQVSLLVLWNNGSDDQAVVVLATYAIEIQLEVHKPTTVDGRNPAPIDTYIVDPIIFGSCFLHPTYISIGAGFP